MYADSGNREKLGNSLPTDPMVAAPMFILYSTRYDVRRICICQIER